MDRYRPMPLSQQRERLVLRLRAWEDVAANPWLLAEHGDA